jgi:tryptophan-rich hypothetical protein
MNPLNVKKLLLSKWTATKPIAKDKHFLVSKVLEPADPSGPVEWVELEAVYSKSKIVLEWRKLRDADHWQQGWV